MHIKHTDIYNKKCNYTRHSNFPGKFFSPIYVSKWVEAYVVPDRLQPRVISGMSESLISTDNENNHKNQKN